MRDEEAGKAVQAGSLLKEVQKMVRFGMYRDISSLLEWSNQVSAHLKELDELMSEDISVLEPEGFWQYVSLHAEYLDTVGRIQEAQEVLQKVVPANTLSVESWIAEHPYRRSALAGHWTPDEDERYARWVRQIGWLHMEYAWVTHYRTGYVEKALDYLEGVHKYLRRELIEPAAAGRRSRPSHGTLFRYFYYRGQCERSLRRFRESLQSFTDAQRHAGDRYRLKTMTIQAAWGKLPPEERKEATLMRLLTPERRFSVISTARILGGGLAWNSIQRGRLRHAQEMCLSAETLLLGTGQEPMRAFIRSNRLVAQRRAEQAGSEGFGDAMAGLATSYHEYRDVGDPLGQLRCGIELVRGHLDALQSWKAKKVPDAAAGEALETKAKRAVEMHLKALRAVANQLNDRHWRYRVELLQVRYDLHLDPAGIKGTVAIWRERLADMGEGMPSGQKEAEHLMLLAEVERLAGNGKEAIHLLQHLIGRSRYRNQGQLWDQDPVVRAECHLRLAALQLECSDFDSAKAELEEWRMLSQLVEHAHLHEFAAEVERQFKDDLLLMFTVKDNLNWDDCYQRLRKWIVQAARNRAGEGASATRVAEILGVDTSTYTRWDDDRRKKGK